MSYPSIDKAFRLLNDMCRGYGNRFENADEHCENLRVHSLMVACCAQMIAAKIPGMDANKAYILALLHDYGKIRSENNSFHGLIGYKLLKSMGYDDSARICLSHSFQSKNFRLEDYDNYDRQAIFEAKNALCELDLDDYDLLVQLCDLLVLVGVGYVSLKSRLAFVKQKYGLPIVRLKRAYRDTLNLKKYFDLLCGCDIYLLLGIKEDKVS